MGAWDTAGWDNDGAADWFGEMFDDTGLAKHVEETLNLDAEDSHEEIRAAAYILVALGRSFIWPVEDIDRHLALAISKLQEIREMDILQDASGFVEAIDADIEVLKSRLEPPGPNRLEQPNCIKGQRREVYKGGRDLFSYESRRLKMMTFRVSGEPCYTR